MQIKRLAALSLAAILTAAMLTGCDLLAWLAWLEENSDSSSVTSSPSSSSTSRPSYDDDDDDTGNTGDTGGEDTETPNPNDPTTWTITNDGKLIVPEGTTTIPANAFANNEDITSLDLTDSDVTSIEKNAFWSTGLTIITLPEGLTSIGAFAFSECTGLTSIRVGTGIMSATIGENAFADVPYTVIIYYPSEWDEDGESEKEKKLEALKAKLQKAGLNTDDYRYMPDSEMLQAAPAAPAGVKELLDVAGLFGP